MESPHAHSLRRGRISEPGRSYLLTAVTRNRQRLFTDLIYARTAIQQLRKIQGEGVCRSLAWVLMPDHLHWLVELGAGTLANLMCSFKSRSSVALYRTGAIRQHIWQQGFHDRALRRDEDIKAVALYIIRNPIRAGIVRRVGEYSHWDCVWL
ncbi:MAG: transposase [Pantoea sp.]|uniref:REP-associated tyrosine transposase n=1 Tax=Pantoea sp. TaxID=69393 RepID=UPI00120AEF16|nr:transposase [Pantoea sp.]RZK04327.1 MAG: transposase [Pantoea sp.]